MKSINVPTDAGTLAAGFTNPDYSPASDRELSTSLSAYLKTQIDATKNLEPIERELSDAREANTAPKDETLASLNYEHTRLSHALRQIYRIKEEQRKRGAGRRKLTPKQIGRLRKKIAKRAKARAATS